MKLHLPVKLRASLIAAVIAVPALVYNAFAGEHYTAPSDAFGWDNNDIEFTAKLMETAGNTYTAREDVKYALYPGTTKPVGLYDDGSGNTIQLDYDAETGRYIHPTETDDEGKPIPVTPTSYDTNGTDGTPAEIIVATKDYEKVSYVTGDTTLDADAVDFRNSLASATAASGSTTPYAGDMNVKTDELKLTGENIRVVLEDANVNAGATSLSTDSQLVILNGTGAADQFSEVEQGLLGVAGIPVNDVNDGDAKAVALGTVSGGGSVTIIGDGSNVNATMSSVDLEGSLNLGDANAAVSGDVKATEIALIGSETTVTGDVTFDGLVVDADSVLSATGDDADISNAAHGGAGYVNVSGKVEAADDIFFDNGKADKQLGVKDGAVVVAGGDVTLRNVDAVKAETIHAGEDLTLVSASTIQGLKNDKDRSDDIKVGGNLVVGDGSSITDAELSVAGSVTISNDAPGLSVGSLDSSSISNTDITVTPAATSNVTVTGGSSMTDSTIVGANGNITVSDNSTVTVTDESGATRNFIGADKENLADILTAAGSATPLTKESLADIELTAGSVIGNTSGSVTITDSKVDSTLVTGGGDITIADTKDTPDASQAIAAVKDIIADALANPVDGAVVIPYVETNAQFGTVVDGSIIDVRGNLGETPTPENDLTVDSAALTNSVVLGVTGKITVSDSLLGNDYIDGGSGIEIDNSVIVDTDIVNMNADIVLKDNISIISTDEDKPFVMTTKGTAEITDYDEYTGGSIILEGADLQNGVIKSGVTAERNADGTYTYTPTTSETDAMVDDGTGTLTSLGTKLPYGQIKVTDSSLSKMDISTVAGDVALTGTSATAPGATETPYTRDDNCGGITGFKTSLNTLGASGATKLTSISVMERDGNGTQPSGVYLRVTDSLGNVVATSTNAVTFANAASMQTFEFADVAIDPAEEYTFSFVNANGDSVQVQLGLTRNTADGIKALHPTTDLSNYTAIVEAGYIASSNDATAEGWTPSNTVVDSTITTGAGNIAVTKTLVDSSDVTTGAGNIGITTSKVVDSNIISEGAGDVRIEAASLVETSVVSTVEGDVTIIGASSVLGSDVSTEDGALSVNGSTVNSVDVDGTLDKSTLTATDSSNIINGAYVSGTDISISDTDGDDVAPGLDIYGNALTTVEGDVNMTVDGRIYVNTNGKLALDGDKEGENTRDASVTADSLVLNDIYDKQASIANAQVAVTTKTMLKDGNTLTLDSVNSAEGESAGTLGDLLQMGDPNVQDTNGNWSEAGITTVAIKGGSILEAGRIGVVTYASQGGDSVETADVTNAHNYFDKITVVEDSKVTVSGKALVNTLHVNVGQEDTTTAGSKVTFEKDAYLTNAQIRGEGEKTYLGSNQDGPEVTIKGNGHVGNLRMDDEGAISFVGDGTQKSYIADIAPTINGEAHGVINVVGGELVTPVLNHGNWLSLGLNGGTVTLDSVTAEQGATIASTDSVNAHVRLDLITNASQTGAPDVTPVGQSTIRTTLDRVTAPYSYTEGTPTETVATTYYYKVMSDTTAAAETTVQRWNGTALETVTVAAGDTLKSGDIITKTDKELTYFTKADGSLVANGVVSSDAATLTQAEESYLVRITVPLVDAEGNLRYEETAQGTALVVGQTVTQNTLSYQDGVAETPGTIETMTDGIASLRVLETMDSDNTVIKAYETGSYTYYAADGTVLDPATATPEELAAARKVAVADANTGLINIEGALTGQDNSLYADNNISIGGIIADADNRDYENGNTVISGRGDISVGGSGIFGSSNTLDAQGGSVTVSGGIKGNDNTLTAGDEVQINGIVAGNDNSITAGTYVSINQGIGTVDDETSDGNTVLAKDGDVTLGEYESKSIHGNSNSITAEQGDITMSGKILGNDNILTAKAEKDAEGAIVDGGNISGTSVEGDRNQLLADASVSLTGSVTGDENVLTAGTSIEVTGAIDGNSNALTAGTTIETGDITGDENKLEAGESITTGAIEGNKNALTAGTTIETGDITGHENKLEAGESITTGAIEGDKNALTAGTTIETGDITGDENKLEAGESITTGAIDGNSNELTAGTSIATGDITGDDNVLNSGTTIDTGVISGNDNKLTAKDGDITIGGLDGTGNVVSSEKQDIIVEGDVIGDASATPNSLTAAGTVTIEGNLGGVGTEVTAYANGLGQDDVAISVGSFNAQGTDLTIATTNDATYGYASGNGSIIIGSMNAVDGAVDSALVNNIISNNSYVQIGAMNGYEAYTNITAAKDVIIGTDASTFALRAGATEQSAANQTIKGANFQIKDSVANLTLTDSTVNVTNSISGTGLTLTTTVSGMDAPVFASSAASVTLDSLEIGGNASLTATTVNLTNLTIDGAYATLAATNLTATGKLTLKNGAVFDINRVTVKELEIENSILNVSTLKGIQELTLTNADAIISGGLTGMTGDVVLRANDEGEGSSLQTSVIDIDGSLNVSGDSDALVTGNITADKSVSATGGSSIQGLNITTDGAITAEGDSTITANGKLKGQSLSVDGSTVNAASIELTGGALTAENGSDINGNVTGAGNVTITGSSADNIAMSGILNVTDGSTVGDVTGATNATVTDSTVGDIGMSGILNVTNNSTVGDVTGATNATVQNSTVGDIAMDGILNATNSTVGDVIGATSAELNDVDSGSITMKGDDGDITITNGSLVQGNVSNANNVTITGSVVTGTVETDGVLNATDAVIQGGLTADSVVTSATISGSTIGSGITSTGEVSISNASTVSGAVSGTTVSVSGGSSTGDVTATTGNATIDGAAIVGNVRAEKGTADLSGGATAGTVKAKDVVLNGAVTETVTATDSAQLTGGTVAGDVKADTVTMNGTTITGSVLAESSAKLTEGSVGADVKVTGEDGKATIIGTEVTGNVTADYVETQGADIKGKITIGKGAGFSGGTVEKDVVVDGGSVKAENTQFSGSVSADTVEIIGGSVAGNVSADGTVVVKDTSTGTVKSENGGATVANTIVTGDVSAKTDSILTVGSVSGKVTVTDGAVTITGTAITGTVNADSVDMTGGKAGDVTADNGDATIDGGAEVGSVTASGTVSVENATTGTLEGATVSANEATVNGSVNADTAATLTGGSVSGNVDVTDGAATITGTKITGTVTADSVDMTSGTAGVVTADNGDATIKGGAVVGDVTATGAVSVENATTGTLDGATVSATEATVNGSVNADTAATLTGGTVSGNVDVTDGAATITGTEIAGTVTADSVDMMRATSGDVKGDDVVIDLASRVNGTVIGKEVSIAESFISDSVSGDEVSLFDGAWINGDVNAGELYAEGNVTAAAISADSMELSDGELVADSVKVGGEVLISSASVWADTLEAGSVTGDNAVIDAAITAGDVTLTNSSAKDMTMTGDLVATGSSIGSVSGAASAVITGGSTGDLSVNGDVTATNGADIASISKADDVTLAQAVTGDITASGKVTAATGTVMGDVTSGSAVMSGAKADSLKTGALSVTPEGFAAAAGISADGVVSIAGTTTAGKSISLKGAEGSAISGADVTAGDKLTLDGTIAAADTTLTGTNGVAVQGTLNAGKGVKFAGGAVTGTGTINKTGGDTLELAGNTDLTGGAVNVDASTLAAADGAKLGSVALKGAVMSVAGSAIGSVTADNLKSDAAGTLETNVDLAARKADTTVVSGKVDLNGASIAVAPTGVAAEGSVADQTRINIISGSVTSGANEDVTHSMDTLNAHIENTADGVDLVLSKNYKGAENKTQNQSATADALASINPAGVPADSPLADVLDALAHTRSEADAKLALDSLSGAGLSGLQKTIAEDSKEHMQTLRATMKALNADVQRRYDDNGIIPGVQSSAISASVTGGTADISGDDNCGDYHRSSIGGMVAMAHALYNGWTFGSSFAFSYADAECGDVTMDGEFIYVDLAMMHKGKRLSQTGTIGAAFIDFDTEREVSVNAPGHSFAGRAEGSTSAVAINMSYEMAYDLLKSENGHRLGSVVLAEATFAQIDGMTETGLGNAGVNAEFDDVASLTFGIGARYTYEFGSKKAPGYFNLDVMAVAEAGDNTPKVNNMFIGGGQTYELVGPEAGTIGLRINAGVLLPVSDQFGIFGNVTSEIRSEQSGVGGSVGVKYSF